MRELIGGIAENDGHRLTKLVGLCEDIGIKESLAVGFAQVFSLIPGSSRSGTTITGGLLAGLTRDVAARFSFRRALGLDSGCS